MLNKEGSSLLNIGALVDGKYKIIKILGRGGTSCVFLAENIRLGNYWAIKEVYKGDIAGAMSKGGKLIAESRILTRLRHPGLPAIVDVIETYQSYLIVMEYIEGISLDKLLEQKGPQTEQVVRKWGTQLCDVLHYLHTQQPPIVYRDMKPANIMLRPDGDVVLIDFGMAREFKINNYHDTNYLGTHGYAAPEQYDNKRQTDARADIYGLGMTLYQLVTGQDPCVPPYGARPMKDYNPQVSYDFEQIVRKCIQLHPEDRFQTAWDLKANLSTDINKNIEMTEDISKKSSGGVVAIVAVAVVLFLVIVIGCVVIVGSNSSSIGWDFGFDDFGWMSKDDSIIEDQVYVSYPEEWILNEFVPEISGYYVFNAVSENAAPIAWLYDEDGNTLASDNIYGVYSEMVLTCWLEEGNTYYLDVTLWDLHEDKPTTGTIDISVELLE